MPSKTVFKQAHEPAYRDDPLAELSRIMGLNDEARKHAEASDDFGIDLEQELLGDLSGADEPVAANTSSPSDLDAAVEDALASEIDSVFEDIFAQDGQQPEAIGEEPVPEAAAPAAFVAPVEPDPDIAEPHADLDAEPVFDDADFADLDAALADTAIAEQASIAPVEAAEPVQEAHEAEVAVAGPSFEDELRGLLVEPAELTPAAEAEAFEADAFTAGQADNDVSLDEFPAREEARIAADLAAGDETVADDEAFSPDFNEEEANAAYEGEPELKTGEAQAFAADEELTAAEPALADGASAFDAADFQAGEAAAYADAPASYADEPVAYSDEPAAYADEPTAYADVLVASRGEAAAYEEAEFEAYEESVAVEPTDYAAMPHAGDAPAMEAVEKPLLDAADFQALEDELAVPDGHVELGGPADDDVEAFAAEPGEWLAAEAVADVPADGYGTEIEAQGEWQPAEVPAADHSAYAESVEANPTGHELAAVDPSWSEASFEEPIDPIDIDEFHDELAGIVEAEFAGEPVVEVAMPDWQASEAQASVAAASHEAEAQPADEFADIDLPLDFAEYEPGLEAEQPEQPRPQPQPTSADGDDPFAALAALAAAPPILKVFGRTNPVAVNPTAERPGASQSQPKAPEPAPEPVSYFSVTRRSPETPAYRPVEQATVAPATAAPVAPVPAAVPSNPADHVTSGTATASTFAAPDFAPVQQQAPEAPEVETIEVAENVVPAPEDLEIPDLPAFETTSAVQGAYDDFDNEFADSYHQLTQSPAPTAEQADARPAQWQQAPAAPASQEQDFEAALEADLARIDAISADFGTAQHAEEPARAHNADLDDDYEAPMRPHAYAQQDDDAYAVGAGFAGDAEIEQEEPQQRRRGLLIAAIVAGVALAGGIGAFAFSFGGGGGEPALVRADPGPVKVKPENPGGVVVPNQDGKVYERVAGARPSAPEQEKLVTTVEEPIEKVVAQADTALSEIAASDAAPATSLPGVEPVQIKSEDRVTPGETAQAESAGSEIAGIAPRKVRTMIVRPDGTLVPRPDPEPAAAAAPDQVAAAAEPLIPNAADGAGNDVSILPADAQSVTVPSADEASAATPVDADDVVVPQDRPSNATGARSATQARAEPAAPAPEPAQAQVAAVAPAAPEPAVAQPAVADAASTAGTWQVQIASQPSREGAQASYEDMARRYSSVLGGKPVNIVQADIPNKGTFWRVRIPAASKADANILCAKLKTAGGNCFISQ